MAPVLRHCPCLRPENDDVRLLDYSHSNLEDVPNEVFGFERTLEELYLDANQIKDLPRPLFHCHGLRKLNLSDNEVQTLPPAVASLINLEQLDISKNGVLEIPDNIKGCKCLNMIDASVNPLGKLPEGFTQLINLQELYLNDTFLEYLPANFGRLSRLRILELRENHLKVLPKSMARLTELHRLDIGQNDFVDLPEVIGNLPRLVELWCDCNNLTCLPPFLGGLKKLAYLDASKNRIYDIADEIEGCISLCDLTLSTNRIKVLPEGIANLKKITVMRLDENRLVHLPANIGNLCNLEELVMSSNDLTKMPCSVGLLRSLRTLIADDNLLEELPSEMGSCLKLTIMSLRDNKLVQIPDELGHITSLKVINLSGNLLQYLPFSIAKLPNLQALWLSENQNKPLIPLQSDTDKETGQKVLTCFMLPQVPFDEEVREVDGTEGDAVVEGKGRHLIKFAFDAEKDQPSKLIRAPTPYPKELKAHARHARNYALKKQGLKDTEGNEILEQKVQNIGSKQALSKGAQPPKIMTPDIMILPVGAPENRIKVKEAIVTKPKSPLSSPSLQERHKVFEQKADLLNETPEIILQHMAPEANQPEAKQENPLDIPSSEVPLKVLGRRDSRGDGSSSERSSASPAGSPKSATAKIHSDARPINETEGKFKKNSPASGSKREIWMRQRLLRQGSGDSDRGYRSDHEVYLAERDQYGQFYSHHDGYASDWEAFLSKQNYPSGPGPVPIVHQYARLPNSGDLGYRGNAEGQEIDNDGEQSYWDFGYHYTDGNEHGHIDERHQTRIPSHQGYWQMDPSSGVYYETNQPFQSIVEGNKTYFYPRKEHIDVVPLQPQLYFPDAGNYQQQPPPPNVWLPRHHPSNSPRTLPKRLSDSSPRLKRSQCISVQAPLHSHPQEYHLMPQVPSNVCHPAPGSSPRPGRSPSPRAVPVYPNSTTHLKYAPQNSHLQPRYPGHAFPVTTQPMNSAHLPPPPHMQYYSSFEDTAPTYPVIPPSPRMKHIAQPYVVASDEPMQSYNTMPPPGIHSSIYYSSNKLSSNNQPESCGPSSGVQQYLPTSRVSQCYQDYTYSEAPMHGNEYRVNLSSENQCFNNQTSSDRHCGDFDYSGRTDESETYSTQPVPSINIIPSTSPPQTSYLSSLPLEQEGHKVNVPKDSEVSVKADKSRMMTEVQSATVANNDPIATLHASSLSEKSTSLSQESNGVEKREELKQKLEDDPFSTSDQSKVIDPLLPTCHREHLVLESSYNESSEKCTKNVQNSPLVNKISNICVENVKSTKNCNSALSINSPRTFMQRSGKVLELTKPCLTIADGGQDIGGSENKVSNSNEGLSRNTNQPIPQNRYGTYKAMPLMKSTPNSMLQNSSLCNESKHVKEENTNNIKSISSDLGPSIENKNSSNVVYSKSNHDENLPGTFNLETIGNNSTTLSNNSRYITAHVVKTAVLCNEVDIQNSSDSLFTTRLPQPASDLCTVSGRNVQIVKGQSSCDVLLSENRIQSTKQIDVKNANLVSRSDDFSSISQPSSTNSLTTISSIQDKQQIFSPNIGTTNQTCKEVKFSKRNYSCASVPGYPVQVKTMVHNDCSSAGMKKPSTIQGRRENSTKEISTSIKNNVLKTHSPVFSVDNKNISTEANQKSIPLNQLKRQHSNEDANQHLIQSSFHQHHASITKRNSKNAQDILNANDIAQLLSMPQNESLQYKIENKNDEKSLCIGSDNSSETPVCNKRFQKVLPPFDKTHVLKPSGVLNVPLENEKGLNMIEKNNDPDVTHVDGCSLVRPTVPERSDSRKATLLELNYTNCPPLVPPKKNVPCSAPGKESVMNKPPPLVPPKPASMAEIFLPPVPPHKKIDSKCNATVTYSDLNVKIEVEKNMDSKDSESVQPKDNMPDLLSRIGPEEKEQMLSNKEKNIISAITKKDEEKPLKIHAFEHDKTFISDEKNSFTPTNEKNLDSPKSPKRHSWLFGTHKNSLVFPVIILKNPGLGFSIEGGIGSPRNPNKPQDDGIYVAQVSANGPAFSTLKSGDKILQVDGIDFTKLDHFKAVATLQDSGPSVSLMVSRE